MHINIPSEELWDAVRGVDLAELCITSGADISQDASLLDSFTLPEVSGAAVSVHLAEGEKCQRCWKVTECHSKLDKDTPVCARCEGVLRRDFDF